MAASDVHQEVFLGEGTLALNVSNWHRDSALSALRLQALNPLNFADMNLLWTSCYRFSAFTEGAGAKIDDAGREGNCSYC